MRDVPLNVFSVDVEDWFTSSYEFLDCPISLNDWVPPRSVVGNTRRMLDLLEESGARGTFFVLGFIAGHYPGLVKEIAARGHEVASHAFSHRLLYRLSRAEVRDELERSIGLLEDLTGRKVIGFRAPYFSVTRRSLWVLDLLPEFGILYDSSIFPFRRGLYGIAGYEIRPQRLESGIWEFPISVLRIGSLSLPLGGGGYMRLLPVDYFRLGIHRLNAGGVLAVMYFHPYELDARDVKIPAGSGKPGLKRRLLLWQQAVGRGRMRRKIRRLLAGGRFGCFRDVLKTMAEKGAPPARQGLAGGGR